jgi:hypothetical protein
MALFHAALSADLGLSPSRFYPYALDYFRGSPGWDQWEFVGYQGIADVACRHGDEPLSQAVAHLPKEPLVALCHCLERRALAPPLLDALIHRLREAMTQTPPDITVLAALVRGLSASGHHPPARTAIAGLLAHPASTHIEILAAISGRGWEMLLDDALLQAYLLRLATNDHGQAAFEHCISDLLSLPSMSSPARRALRAPGQPAAVREAFARMTADATPSPRQ